VGGRVCWLSGCSRTLSWQGSPSWFGGARIAGWCHPLRGTCMLTSLLHSPSHATCSHGFPWCSMKSIGSVLLCHKIPLCLLHRVSIRVVTVPCLTVRRVSQVVCQTAPEAASYLIDEKLKNSSCAPLS